MRVETDVGFHPGQELRNPCAWMNSEGRSVPRGRLFAPISLCNPTAAQKVLNAAIGAQIFPGCRLKLYDFFFRQRLAEFLAQARGVVHLSQDMVIGYPGELMVTAGGEVFARLPLQTLQLDVSLLLALGHG